jgi:Na+-transporting NADH:ubiquinone oxidoreductase subunit NqrC
MKIALIIIGIFVAIIAIVAGACGISYISAYNMGNTMENTITATYDNNKNILAQYGNKVIEASQVTEMRRDDVTKVITAAMEGRYGDNGSKAVVQMIKEQNPSLDASVYIQIQRIVEAGRNDFQNGQTKLIDQKRVYQTVLGSFWSGTWMRIAGYPKIDLTKYEIVSTDKANAAFDTKIETPMKLR